MGVPEFTTRIRSKVVRETNSSSGASERASSSMQPVKDITEAVREVEEWQGAAVDFELSISDSINDAIGINMSIVTDAILVKGWEPKGFIQKEGFRVYLYVSST